MRKSRRMRTLTFFWLNGCTAAFILCGWPVAAAAITPDQVLLVVNKVEPQSAPIAEYYMKMRRIPPDNIIRIRTALREGIDRKAYDTEIAAPIRDFLSKNDPDGNRFKCLLLIYGIPLRIEVTPLKPEESKRLSDLQVRLTALKKKLDQAGAEKGKLEEEMAGTKREMKDLNKAGQGAAVDSELALVMEENHPLDGWLPNRYFYFYKGKSISGMSRKAIAVSRLDGPSAAIVYRIIDDSLQAEAEGLAGKAYFDARWTLRKGKDLNGYERYDRAIHNTARLVEKSGKLQVILDEKETLFGPGKAPDAALYCGWYSLGKYVDAFTWKKGAVGFHVASAECTTLKTPSVKAWCKAMLEKGVAATLGPVAEPYIKAFPVPELFFGCLLGGNALVDCYTVSNPFWSWQMILLGDPLYRPFKDRLQ